MRIIVNTDIVIVDTGVNLEHPFFKDEKIEGFSLLQKNNETIIGYDIQDKNGHGTAVYGIIRQNAPKASIVNIKLLDYDDEISENDLIYALKYINENITTNIINLSLGVKSCEQLEYMQYLCKELSEKGVVIVAAFDNDGGYSYPALLDYVIGVDSSDKCKRNNDFEFVENNKINIRAKGNVQRVLWTNPNYVLFGGNSFACAHISAYISKLKKTTNIDYYKMLLILRKKAIYIHHDIAQSNRNYPSSFNIKKIKNVAIFPFNKEIHSLIRFSNLIKFNIDAIYDVIQTGRIGAKTSKLLSYNEGVEYVIKDIKDISWETIDTIILGHTEMLNNLLGNDVKKQIIINASKNNVNIYSFDVISNEYLNQIKDNLKINICWPEINKVQVPFNTFGKLFNISKPVFGIFGTSSQQGKFTLQIILKQLIEKQGYSIGCIGTEPQSLLLNMDFVYPMGYNSAVYINDHDSITMLNSMLYELSHKNDIIMVGSQANTIPYNTSNVSDFPCKQFYYLLATQPDAVILCINPYDDFKYISNTIKFIESLISCNVIALVVFPMTYAEDWRGLYGSKIKISQSKYYELTKSLQKKFKIPIFMLGNEENMNELCQMLIDFF